jgi:hypothetical protein
MLLRLGLADSDFIALGKFSNSQELFTLFGVTCVNI